MEHLRKRMAELLIKQMYTDISQDEMNEIEEIRSQLKLPVDLLHQLQDKKMFAHQVKFWNEFDEKASWKKFKKQYRFKPSKKERNILYIKVTAAIFLLMILICLLFYIYE